MGERQKRSVALLAGRTVIECELMTCIVLMEAVGKGRRKREQHRDRIVLYPGEEGTLVAGLQEPGLLLLLLLFFYPTIR